MVDFSSNGLTEQAKSLIAPAKWNLSGVSEEAESIPVFYSLERATSITWTGEIGLMYPSDYGYATTGGNSTDRAGCLNLSFEDWRGLNDCYSNTWLYYEEEYRWTIILSSEVNIDVFRISESGHISTNFVYSTAVSVLPSVYLSPDVKIVGGDGSEINPFELSL